MEKRDFSTTYDVIVAGAGCAGIAAALGIPGYDVLKTEFVRQNAV